MNVLLVDDQEIIIDSVKKGVRWELLPVEEIYTATSSLEAKLIFTNFEVDLLITDIEMPNENGIELAKWAKEKYSDVEIVFLTSHPDFKYTKQAIQMHIFDYILQPVKYIDIENMIVRVEQEIDKKEKVRSMEQQVHEWKQQGNALFDSLIIKCQTNRNEEANKQWKEIRNFYVNKDKLPECYVMLINIQHWMKVEKQWSDSLISFIFTNVHRESLQEINCEVVTANTEPGKFWIFFVTSENSLTKERMEEENKFFFEFMKNHSNFRASMYVNCSPIQEDIVAPIQRLMEMDAQNKNAKCDIFYQSEKNLLYERENLVEMIMTYVHDNIWKKGNCDISRVDVAAFVSLSQEYMSRIFKERTGISFKDYVLQEKMKFAEKLLRETNMSVSVIASKVGFSNFSHFSSMFRRFYKETPLDYRKKTGK